MHTHTRTHAQPSWSLNTDLQYWLWREGVGGSSRPRQVSTAASKIQRPANTLPGLYFSPRGGGFWLQWVVVVVMGWGGEQIK